MKPLDKNHYSVYECWKDQKIVAYCGSEKGALEWLSSNGGGLYKNTLHKYQFEVNPGEFKNME